jgi:WD40 repeat protein
MIANRIGVLSMILLTAQTGFAQEPTVLKHDGWVAAVAFAPDGKTLASAGADNVVRLWEVGTWKPKGVLKGHTDCVTAIAFSRRVNGLMVTGSFDRSVRFWNLNGGEPPETLGRCNAVVLAIAIIEHPWNDFVFTGSLDGKLRIMFEEAKPNSLQIHKSWVNSLAIHNDKSVLATGSSDGTVYLGGPLLQRGKEKEKPAGEMLQGGAGEVRCVAFSPDGKLLAAGNRYHTVRIWDVATRKEIKTLGGHMGDVWSIAFSPDGKTLATVDTDWKKPSKIRLYDTATWKVRGTLDMPGEILSIAYSPKGDWLAAGSWDKTVRVFAIK